MRTQTPGALTFPVLRRNAEDVLTVSEDEIVEALRFLLFRMKILAEPTGAVAAAAALFGKLPPGVGSVGVVISGGNVDPEALARFVGPTAA
jgi:threonine dehydratase